MDLPNADLYQLLNPPAFVESYRPMYNLETLISQKVGISLSDTPYEKILNELEISIKHSKKINMPDKKGNRLYELRVKPDGYIVAGFIYSLNPKNQETRLNTVVYPRKNKKALIILYKELPMESYTDWKDAKRIDSIFEDTGEFEYRLKNLYKWYKDRKRKEEEHIKEKGVTVLAQILR